MHPQASSSVFSRSFSEQLELNLKEHVNFVTLRCRQQLEDAKKSNNESKESEKIQHAGEKKKRNLMLLVHHINHQYLLANICESKNRGNIQEIFGAAKEITHKLPFHIGSLKSHHTPNFLKKYYRTSKDYKIIKLWH